MRLANSLVTNDVVVGECHGKAWALLPLKAMIDRDGNLLRDVNGKIRYSPIVESGGAELRQEFSKRVVALVRAKHPDAFDAEPAL